jgi:hypothetical protein
VTLTYTGVVGPSSSSSTSEKDVSGLFGTAGSSLVGLPYTAVYVYDITLGINLNSRTPNYFDVYGGTFFGTPTPTLSETMTINGITVSLTDTYIGEIILCSVCVGANLGFEEVAAANSEMTNILYAFGSPNQFPPSLDGSLNFSVVSNTTGGQGSRGQFAPDGLDLIPGTVGVTSSFGAPGPIAGAGLPGADVGVLRFLCLVAQGKKRDRQPAPSLKN